MATIIENSKGFKVIKATRAEMISHIDGSIGICDDCNQTSEEGYLISVLNMWFCPTCYRAWMERSKRYFEDIPVELRAFDYYKEIFNL